MPTTILYEHPLNERVRTFLRLEHLFERVEFFSAQTGQWPARAAVEGLLDIVTITARSDIKQELLKEIDRNLISLLRISNQQEVDQQALSGVIADLEQAAADLHELVGTVGASTREDPFFKAIAQRSSIPGGACSFDLPGYQYLLGQSPQACAERLHNWSAPLIPVSKAISLLLSLARNSANPRTRCAAQGFFQETLDSQVPIQLIRIALDSGQPIFPEVSGHKNRFTVRFMAIGEDNRPRQTEQDLDFQLTCCVF